MKGITLITAICFLWVTVTQGIHIVYTFLTEQLTIKDISHNILWLNANVATFFAYLSGSAFFFILYLKQLKK